MIACRLGVQSPQLFGKSLATLLNLMPEERQANENVMLSLPKHLACSSNSINGTMSFNDASEMLQSLA
jgi:hypothetical protein